MSLGTQMPAAAIKTNRSDIDIDYMQMTPRKQSPIL